MTLKKKALDGLVLVFFSTYLWKIVDFIATLILARILSPEDFGVVKIALTIIFFLFLFPAFGMASALIQRQKDVKKAADTVFLLSPGIALLLIIILNLTAPFIARFYGEPALSGMLQVLSICIFFSAIRSVPFFLFDKHLEYKKRIIPEIISPLVMSVLSIILAYMGFGGWAIIWGFFAQYLTSAILVWIITEYRPSLDFDWQIAKELFAYGKDMYIYYFIIYSISNVTYAVLGKAVGLAAAGFFSLSETVSMLVFKNVTKLINRVTFPYFSAMQKKKEEIRRQFGKIIEYVAFVVFPANLGMFVLADDLLFLLDGQKWMPAVPLLRVMLFSGIFFALSSTTSSVFFALDKNKIISRILTVQFVILMLAMVPSIYLYGTQGAVLALAASYLFTLVATFMSIKYILRLDIGKLVHRILYIPVSAVFMAVSVGLLREFLPDAPSIIGTLFLVGVGGAIYFGVTLFLNKGFYKRLIREVFSHLGM